MATCSPETFLWAILNPGYRCGEILVETDLAGANPIEYIYFAGRRAARRHYLGTVQYFLQDHLGSTRVMASATGAIVRESDYYPFGGERLVSGTVDDPHKFAGMYRDGESGLYHTWARMYSPELGRWLAPDFLGGETTDPNSLNRYAYVGNNPTNFIDPLGLDAGDPMYCYYNEQGILICAPGTPIYVSYDVYYRAWLYSAWSPYGAPPWVEERGRTGGGGTGGGGGSGGGGGNAQNQGGGST